MNINKAITLALKHYREGNVEKTESLFREILKVQPYHVEALHFLGVVYSQRGQYDLAIQHIQRALQIDSTYAEAYVNLGAIFQERKQLDEAIGCYRKAMKLDPEIANTYFNLGIALQDIGDIDEAILCYQKALKLNFNTFGLYNNLGLALQSNGELDESIKYYRKALQINPEFADAWNNLGNAVKKQGRLDEAVDYYRKALHANPNFADACFNLGSVAKDKGRLDEAIQYYQKTLQLQPFFIDAYFNLGNTLKEDGKSDDATRAYDIAILLSPTDLRVRFAKCFSQLPLIYSDQENIQISRNRYANELTKLHEIINGMTSQEIKAGVDLVGNLQPFYLAYQGFNDRELQRLYGDLVCRIMAFGYPQFAERPVTPLPQFGEPLRIGFVSGFFNLHSNWKIPIKGWIANLDKQRFKLYGYYTADKKDIATEEARHYFTRFVEDIHAFEELCATIRKDDLHVLIYPEVGMDATAIRLAALRLAPIQCTSWGHPETSGLASIDYFLSSDLMEPPDAEEHYTEKLIRLSNLSIYYELLDIPVADIDRGTFGLRQNSILYLCSQSLYKYLPQYDEIYPRIAKGVIDCRFLFISHKSNSVTEQFRMRINRAFEKYGMNADDYIVLLPRLYGDEYYALNKLSDVYLDSIGWSGCNSTLEAISFNLPVVTWPGEFMRARHSSAILTMMGLKDTIVSDPDEYIQLAVRLGLHTEWRKQIAAEVAAKKHLVYRDRTSIADLETFLERVVKGQLR